MDPILFQQLFLDLDMQIHKKTIYAKVAMPFKIIVSSTMPLNLTHGLNSEK